MSDEKRQEPLRDRLLEAALAHVAFDGWSDATLAAAAADCGVDVEAARAIFPRGGLGLAVAHHERGDAAMAARIAATDLSELKFRERIAQAVRWRIEAAGDKETVRRAAALFALPQNAPEGARLIWATSDRIWTALGDSSDDINWYTKRATLSGVYSSTLLYWLGDDSPGAASTWEFLGRRIDDVMQIEKAKGTIRENPLLSRLFAGPSWVLSRVKAPKRAPETDLPGRWPGPN